MLLLDDDGRSVYLMPHCTRIALVQQPASLTGLTAGPCIVCHRQASDSKAVVKLSCTCANVQGVTWDPASEFVISQSADRTCRYAATALLPSPGTVMLQSTQMVTLLQCCHT